MTARPEGRYRVRFVKDAGAAAPDFPRGVHVRAGDVWTLIWRPAVAPPGNRCLLHWDGVGKPVEDIVAHAEYHEGSWWQSYDIDGSLIFSDCCVEVLEGPLENAHG